MTTGSELRWRHDPPGAVIVQVWIVGGAGEGSAVTVPPMQLIWFAVAPALRRNLRASLTARPRLPCKAAQCSTSVRVETRVPAFAPARGVAPALETTIVVASTPIIA